MDGVSAASAVVGLVVPAAKLAQHAASLYADLRDAPMNYTGLRGQIFCCKVVLDEISAFNSDSAIPEQHKETLKEFVSLVKVPLQALEKESRKCPLVKNKGIVRVQWTFLSRYVVRDVESQLNLALSLLQNIIGIKSFRQQFASLSHIEHITLQKIEVTNISKHSSGESGRGTDPLHSSHESKISPPIQLPIRRRKAQSVVAEPLPTWLSAFGIQGKVVKSSEQGIRERRVSVQLRSFLFQQPGVLGLIVHIIVRFGVPRPQFDLCTANLVPDNAPIMKSAQQGNLNQVLTLLKNGHGSIYDATPNNYTPLFYAIQSGNIELVKALLNEGAPVNRSFGLNESLDVVRLLLDRGADGVLPNRKGWTPLFYLLPEPQRKEDWQEVTKAVDFLPLLQSVHLELDLLAKDDSGMSILEHVAHSGTSEELDLLFRLRSMLGLSKLEPWATVGNPMYYAITAGNFSTFSSLLHLYDVEQECQDGWTMLDLAARHGHSDIVRRLFHEGAEEFFVDIEEEQAREEEEALGSESTWYPMTYSTYHKYMEILAEFGKIEIRDDDENRGKQDLFWDANEY